MKRLNLFACASAFLLILACAAAAEEGVEGAAQPEGESGAAPQPEGSSTDRAGQAEGNRTPQAEEVEDASADELRTMAQQALRQSEYVKAAALLEQAVQKSGTAEMWNLLGEAYYELERYVDSYEAFQTALEIDPKYTLAVANLEMVKWALPQPGFEDSMQRRFSTPKTIGAQILGSYFTGTAMGGWFLFISSLVGYKEVDDQLTIMASGLVLSSMMRVPEVGKLVSFGHGASRSAFAGAVLPPLIGALIVKLSKENPTRRDLIHGARIGAIFSPLGSTLGYHISTSGLFRRSSSTARHTPFERTETQLSFQFAQFSF